MLVDDVLQAVFVGELRCILFELDLDLRAALTHFRRADLEVILPGGIPGHRLGVRFVGARSDPHRFGHHEHRVEAHAKLADDLTEIHLLLFGGIDEFARP